MAGAAVTIVLGRDGWHSAPSAPPDRDRAAAYSNGAETTIYRRAAPQQRSARGWEAQTTESWSDRRAPSNYPRRVKTVTFAPPPEMTASIPPTAAVPRSTTLILPSVRPPLVKSWRYQLQNINPAEIANSPHDLVVIDYDGGDGDGNPLSKDQVDQMRRKPDGSSRLVVAYLSIGEAESYRSYWNNAWRKQPPAWLGKENSRWRGNYGVRFWHPAWQNIVFEYADRILAAGFDGLYMDKVDQFATLGNKEAMIQFVVAIAARVKAKRSDFFVIAQNGDYLVPDRRFRDAIDAFAREDLFYGEDADGKRNSVEDIRENVARLKILTAERKLVFVVEYLRNEEQAQTARREIAAQGFIGLVTRRALNAL